MARRPPEQIRRLVHQKRGIQGCKSKSAMRQAPVAYRSAPNAVPYPGAQLRRSSPHPKAGQGRDRRLLKPALPLSHQQSFRQTAPTADKPTASSGGGRQRPPPPRWPAPAVPPAAVPRRCWAPHRTARAERTPCAPSGPVPRSCSSNSKAGAQPITQVRQGHTAPPEPSHALPGAGAAAAVMRPSPGGAGAVLPATPPHSALRHSLVAPPALPRSARPGPPPPPAAKRPATTLSRSARPAPWPFPPPPPRPPAHGRLQRDVHARGGGEVGQHVGVVVIDARRGQRPLQEAGCAEAVGRGPG